MRRGIIKAIYSYRDPCNVERSLCEHGAYLRDRGIDSSTGFRKIGFIEDGIRAAQSFLLPWWEWKRTHGTLMLRDEDLREDPEHETLRLTRFLGLEPTPDLVRLVVDRHDARHQEEGSYGSMHLNFGYCWVMS